MRRLQGRLLALLVEAVLLAGGYSLYAWIRDYEGGTSQAAFTRATNDSLIVLQVEQNLHVAYEHGAQQAVLAYPWLVRLLDSFWSYGYVISTVAVFLWIARYRRSAYRALRRAFCAATGVALVIFAAFPTVPPRLLPAHYGMVDTWATTGGISARTPPRLERIADPFAAMPSLHVAWAVWCAYAVIVALGAEVRARRLRWLALLYPVLTAVTVVVTGNHFVLDCILGAALMIGSLRAFARAPARRHVIDLTAPVATPAAPVPEPAVALQLAPDRRLSPYELDAGLVAGSARAASDAVRGQMGAA